MTLHMIRHGMTHANEQRLYCGQTDPPLSPGGRRMLLELRAGSCYPSANAYVVSGLLRTAETLAILYGKQRFEVRPALMEMNFGDFEMKSHDELKNIPDYIKWLENMDAVRCPNGESRNEFNARVLGGLEKIRGDYAERSVVAVLHGGVIVSLMSHLFPEKPRSFYEWQPECGRGYTVELQDFADGIPTSWTPIPLSYV